MTLSIGCEDCGRLVKVKDELVGKRIKCPHCGKGQRVVSNDDEVHGASSPDAKKELKSEDILFGIAGLICEIIFFVGIAIKPGSFEAVMYGGILGLAGLVLAIIGIAARRGRVLGIIAVVLFLLAWVVNTLVIGRL